MFPNLTLRKALLRWYDSQKRDLPWRRTNDPYRIWISEIMLQQTRVAAVIPYYQRFLDRFPTVEALAAADPASVLAAWAGLGYYSRARNLQKAARQIAAAGSFPGRYLEIRELAGIGGYTAAAVASIAFGLPHAAVDGNVLRVLSRLTNDPSDIAAPKTKVRFQTIAGELLDPRRPGEFNQAMMELGATVCLPRQPQCPLCPVSRFCQAVQAGTQNELPVKARPSASIAIDRTVLIVAKSNRLLMWQREAGKRKLGGFWELPELSDLPDAEIVAQAGDFRHSIMNHRYRFTVYTARAKTPVIKPLRWISILELDCLPVSTVARKALSCWTRQQDRKLNSTDGV